MAFRKHRAGEIVIEQTRDLAKVRAILEQGGMITDGIEWPSACYLLAFDGDQAVGVIGVEPILDAALIRSLYVAPPHREAGLARQLFIAARKAAHTRGALTLYLLDADAPEFAARLGFGPSSIDELTAALKGAPLTGYFLAHPEQIAQQTAYRIDISRDGIIER